MAVTTYTLADLRSRLFDRLERVPFWTAAELDSYLNEALGQFNLLTGIWRGTLTLTTTVNNGDYQIPTALTFQSRLLYDGKVMEPTSLFDLTNARPSWRTDTTLTADCPSRPYFWVPLSLELILLWPIPPAGHILTVEGVAATPTLTADADYVDLTEDHFHALLHCATVIALFKEGSERFSHALPLWKDFLLTCAEINGQLKASALFRRTLGLDLAPRLTRGLPARVPGTSAPQPQ